LKLHNKTHFSFKILILLSSKQFIIIKIKINNDKSLNLLNEKALNADFKTDIFVDQKLIRKNEVKPINSQPKNKTKQLPLKTKQIILIIKLFNNKIKRSKFGSYLK
jgi:hypothetical protein